MPASAPILRAALALLAVFSAHYLGRKWIRVRLRYEPFRVVVPWTIRLLLALTAFHLFGPLNVWAYIGYGLTAAAFALGAWDEWRPKYREDLTEKMFGDDA